MIHHIPHPLHPDIVPHINKNVEKYGCIQKLHELNGQILSRHIFHVEIWRNIFHPPSTIVHSSTANEGS